MMIQPPVIGSSMTGANDLDTAENLKGLIVNNFFNEAISKSLNLDPAKDSVEFKVFIPPATNILQVSVDLEKEKKEFGVVLLRNLYEIIVDKHNKQIESEHNNINALLKFNEDKILIANVEVKNLQEQIKKLEDRVSEFNKKSPSKLTSLEVKFLEINLQIGKMNTELKKIMYQIVDSQLEIDKLKIKNDFISNLRILSQPKVSSNPINSMGKKKIMILIAMGLFFGLVAVFLQEFWMNNLVKK